MGDSAAIQTLETKRLSDNDFAYSDRGTCRISAFALPLLFGNLQILLNTLIDHGQIETIRKHNTSRFAKYILNGTSFKIDLATPMIYDSEVLVQRLRNMTVEKRKELGIRKNTL